MRDSPAPLTAQGGVGVARRRNLGLGGALRNFGRPLPGCTHGRNAPREPFLGPTYELWRSKELLLLNIFMIRPPTANAQQFNDARSRPSHGHIAYSNVNQSDWRGRGWAGGMFNSLKHLHPWLEYVQD